MTQKPDKVILFTNGNVLVFNEDDQTIDPLQAKLNCYAKDPDVARRVTNEARAFYIAQGMDGWRHQFSRFEMKALLGVLQEDKND